MGITQRALRVLVGICVILTGLIGSACAADSLSPTQPGPITVSNLTTTSAVLSWARSTDDVGVVGYRVYRGAATGAKTDLTLIASLDATSSYLVSRLYSGTAYKFGIQAIDAANNRSALRTVRLTTPNSSDSTAPPAPTSSPAATPFSDDRVDLMWSASNSSDVAGYQVLRDGTVIATVDLPGSLRYSDQGLSASTSYTYTVRARSSNGLLSPASPAASARTLAPGS
jgi:chitodextrinase